MGRYLFFSDLHAHPFEQFSTRLPSGLNSRLQDCLGIVEQAIKICGEQEVTKTFFLGDLFHARQKIDTVTYVETWKVFKRLGQVTDLHLLIGNHDQSTFCGDRHSVIPFEEFCHIIDRPQYIVSGVGELLNMREVFAVPHLPSEMFKQSLKEFHSARFFLCHQSISEGYIGPYAKTVRGEISIADLPLDRCEYVLAGDYHQRQSFGPNNRISYVGSPLQLNFSEIGQEKAFTLIDTETTTFTTIETSAPKFFKVEGLSIPTEYRKGVDFLRLLITKSQLPEADDIKSNDHRIQIQVIAEEQARIRSQVSFTSSNNDLLFEFISKSNSTLDKSDLLEFGLDCLKSN